jgi:resuscitation-promoting factor RpfA
MALNDIDTDRDPALDQAYASGVREEPRAQLDAAILAAARREAGARPQALGARLRRWGAPMSVAAMVMVSVSLVTLVRDEGGDRLLHPGAPTYRGEEPAVPAARPESATPPQSAHQDPRPVRERAAPDRTQEDRSARPPASGSPALDDMAGESAGKPAQDQHAAASHARARPGEPAMAKQAEQGPDVRGRSARQTEEAGALADAANPKREEEARRQPPAAPSGTDPGERDEPTGRLGQAAEGSRAPAPAATPPSPPAAKARSEPRPQRRPAISDTPELAALLKEYDAQSPRDWLGRIQDLKRAGQGEIADGMLAEFKRRYPGYPLPPELEQGR